MKRYSLLLLSLLLTGSFSHYGELHAKDTKDVKPNVVLIMTDDQGIGDFGFTGNPYIRTPQLDKLASQSLNLTNFYVSPVCAPTRACLMTGRYSERTGVYDTYNGGATMSTDEITIAEVLREQGYSTGIFGKWHLGDNYPYRPIDQGFEVASVHRAGGMGQPGDVYNYFDGDSSYFDPVLFKNGEPVQFEGYCSDVYTDELIGFIKSNAEAKESKPFFAYLSFNAPHTPLQLPVEYYDMYKDLEFDASEFEVFDEVVDKMTPADIEAARKVYGMVTNIDDNVGRVMQTLKEQGIYKNTLIIFLTDNGPQQNRYKLGLRGRKSSVYGGGVRVPCLIHYPAMFKKKSEIKADFAHIDLLPSILDLCELEGVGHKIDGLSIFSPENKDYSSFETRTLFSEWGRGFLQKYQNFSALKEGYKLVGKTGRESGIEDFELYNIHNDEKEKNDILAQNRDRASQLKAEIDLWYDEIINEENNNKTFPAYIGTPYENPVILNRNDAKGTPVAWTEEDRLNYWDIRVIEEGEYDISYYFVNPLEGPAKVSLNLYPYNIDEHCDEAGVKQWTFNSLKIKKGDYLLEPYVQTSQGKYIFPMYVTITRKDL